MAVPPPLLILFYFFPWCELCKKTTADRRVDDVRLQVPEVLARGEGKNKQPQPAFVRARPGRREGHAVALDEGPGKGGGGAGEKGRSL